MVSACLPTLHVMCLALAFFMYLPWDVKTYHIVSTAGDIGREGQQFIESVKITRTNHYVQLPSGF